MLLNGQFFLVYYVGLISLCIECLQSHSWGSANGNRRAKAREFIFCSFGSYAMWLAVN